MEKLYQNAKPADYYSIHPEMNRILEVLANAQFTMSDTPHTSRTLHYYEEKGLLLSTREKTQGWRRFNAYELVWLYIIDHLRIFGYPIENIKTIRDNLMMDEKAGKAEGGVYNTRPFEFQIALSLTSKKEIFYIVFAGGDASYYDTSSLWLWEQPDSYMREPHISIPLAPIIKEIWNGLPKEQIQFELPLLSEVNKTEKEILGELRSGKYEQVAIHFKDKKPEMLVARERKVIKRIEEILKEEKFQKLELIQTDGRVVSIVREVKKKLK